jgi:isocitrate dehydrogenase
MSCNELRETGDSMTTSPSITVAWGDGIGPEIMDASLAILREAGASFSIEPAEIGEKVYLRGIQSGVEQEFWDSIRRTHVLFKGPLTTPQGGGYKSVNVTTRKALGLYANVRPARAMHPFIHSRHPAMDLVVIRENEEDLYAGIEHQQTSEVVQCLKIMSRPGCERIARYAFEYARANGRKRITCLTKDNIMKMTDGLFHRVFRDVATEYPDIATDHLIIDIGAARIADAPEQFDVLLLPNLYGDIVSDITAQLTGSVGLGASANIGDTAAMFEAVHGSAPAIAGKDIANPSGLLLAGVMMMVHLGQPEVAARVHNAWLATVEQGIHTPDIFRDATSRRKVGTRDFANAVISNLGKLPEKLPVAAYGSGGQFKMPVIAPRPPAKRDLVGADVFLAWDQHNRDANILGRQLAEASSDAISLAMITNRGQKVWPSGAPETICTDHWRCRFQPENGQPIPFTELLRLQERITHLGLEIIKTENLYDIDGQAGYSKGQGA